MQAAHHFITRTCLRSLLREKGGKPRSSSSSSSNRQTVLFSGCIHSAISASRLLPLHSSFPPVMKTAHARPESPPSLSHPPTSSIINGCFHYELPSALNHSQSCSTEKGGCLRMAWDISAEKSSWHAYFEAFCWTFLVVCKLWEH